MTFGYISSMVLEWLARMVKMNKISDERLHIYIDIKNATEMKEDSPSVIKELAEMAQELLTVRKNVELALELAIDYDGFDTADGLKSLVNDIVTALKGETKWEKL